MSRQHVLGLYRRLLRQAKMSPLDRRERMVARVRTEFRENAVEEDPARVQELVDKAESAASYIQIVSPKTAKNQRGTVRLVFDKSGKLVEGQGESRTGATQDKTLGNYVDPDALKRHQQLVQRQHFMGR